MIKKLLRVLMRIVLLIVLLAAVLVLVLSLTEYKPADRETAAVTGSAAGTVSPGGTLNIVSWNIGYGALGDNTDFFMDGGSMVKSADRQRLEQNLNGIRDWLDAQAADVMLLQEVDAGSDRSERINEADFLARDQSGAETAFAHNFKALFVPYPLPPIGHVESGLLTLSRLHMTGAERVSLPCPFSWPVRTVNLKRCLLVSRVPVTGTDRELVLINLHLEAYDSGEGKIAQTRQLAGLLKAEADKGNYVIAGGSRQMGARRHRPGRF